MILTKQMIKRKKYFAIDYVPCDWTLLDIWFIFRIIQRSVNGLLALKDRLYADGTNIRWSEPMSFVPDAFLFAVFDATIWGLIDAFDDHFLSNRAIYVLLIGLATRIIIGFSPTIWVSGKRTATFLDMSMIVIIGLLLREIDRSVSSKLNVIIRCFFIVACVFLSVWYCV